MEKLKLQITILRKALKTLQNSFSVYKKALKTNDNDFVLATEDSIIQRFEYTFDGFWKIVKKHLEITYKVEDANSPKSAFRLSVERALCSSEEGAVLVKMANDRNITTHNYDIEEVREVHVNVPQYYELMVKIVDRIEKKIP